MSEVQCQLEPAEAVNVHKFGGSSLKDSRQIEKVVATVEAQVNQGDFIVVSANGHVTDHLLAWMNGQKNALEKIGQYLSQLINSALDAPGKLLKKIKQDLYKLKQMETRFKFNSHAVVAMGELWSAQILSAKLDEAGLSNQWFDTREFLVINETNQLHNRPQAALKIEQQTLKAATNSDHRAIYICTGFIARDTQGNTITMGRNGSDYTATIIADLVGAATVYLWTDVDGIFSADPNLISAAERIDHLTRSEAQALAELGSNVLHENSLQPIGESNTQLIISACGVGSHGTVVQNNKPSSQIWSEVPREKVETKVKTQVKTKVKTLALKNDLVWLSVEGVCEKTSQEIHSQLNSSQISVYASHHDKTLKQLSFCVQEKDYFHALEKIKSTGLVVHKRCSEVSILSAVGHNIRQNHAVITAILELASTTDTLSIHYPNHNHSLSILMADRQAEKLLHELHQQFFSAQVEFQLAVLGLGNIGQQFIEILKANKSRIEQQTQLKLSLKTVANSRYFKHSETCLLDEGIELVQRNKGGEVFTAINGIEAENKVIIDLTASDEVVKQYVDLAQSGWHLISANKIAAADTKLSALIAQHLNKSGRQWLTNTTVGAALPIQDAIRKINASGDTIKQVTGVFSGSISWILGQYDGKTDFMQWVERAHKSALTEPDPRADLSGQDVYRKALILAKEAGIEPANINFKPVIPDEFLSGTLEDFWQNQSAINTYMNKKWQSAHNRKQQLRYLAQITAAELQVELVPLSDDHAAAKLKPGDNIFMVESTWYQDSPLVIQGPGAGKEVTAAGVLTDLVQILKESI